MGLRKRAKKVLNTGNVALGILALAGLFCVLASIEAMQRNYVLRRDVVHETRIKHQLELELAELEYQRIWRQSEEYQELTLRDRLNMIADGERIIELPEPEDWILERAEKVADGTESRESDDGDQPNWQQWARFLLGV